MMTCMCIEADTFIDILHEVLPILSPVTTMAATSAAVRVAVSMSTMTMLLLGRLRLVLVLVLRRSTGLGKPGVAAAEIWSLLVLVLREPVVVVNVVFWKLVLRKGVVVDVVVVAILMLRKPVVVVTIWHCRELRKSVVVVVVAKLWVLLLRISAVVALLRQVVLPTLAPCQEVLQLGVAGGGRQGAAGQAGGHQVGAGARLLQRIQ